MKKDAGSCKDYQPMWYFEPITAVCRRFLFGGCEGNENRFQTSSECWQRCGPTTDRNKIQVDTSSPAVNDDTVDSTTDIVPVERERTQLFFLKYLYLFCLPTVSSLAWQSLTIF
jgi:Kunitz/Bovine pancreatic trypsin inhibitor domain